MTDIVSDLRSDAKEFERVAPRLTMKMLAAADEIEELREALRLTGKVLTRAVEEINSQITR